MFLPLRTIALVANMCVLLLVVGSISVILVLGHLAGDAEDLSEVFGLEAVDLALDFVVSP